MCLAGAACWLWSWWCRHSEHYVSQSGCDGGARQSRESSGYQSLSCEAARGHEGVTVSQCHSLTVWLHITYHIYHGHSPAYQVSQVHPMQWDVGRKLSEIINHFYTEEAGDNVLTAVTDKKFTRAGQETFTLHFTLRAQCNIILMI